MANQVIACTEGRLEVVKFLIEELDALWTIPGYSHSEGDASPSAYAVGLMWSVYGCGGTS
jgi:hypothetical protein